MAKFVADTKGKACSAKPIVTVRGKPKAYLITRGSQSCETFILAPGYRSGSTAALDSYRLLRQCPGRIEGIDGSRIYVCLDCDGQLYNAVFQPAEFEAGVALQVGQGVICQELQLSDGSKVWSNQVYRPTPPTQSEVQAQVADLRDTFQDTGL